LQTPEIATPLRTIADFSKFYVSVLLDDTRCVPTSSAHVLSRFVVGCPGRKKLKHFLCHENFEVECFIEISNSMCMVYFLTENLVI
jgi:hypothetical protein